uniref:Uncharacterized protein n=2 Tax=Mucochytrium quahogii TaxID=96639 RepID=A0A7S2S8H1_9STRA|mmetsp:Transcript_26134/g.56975  ORF Transcript_26134/g.56975 Transcript_26134/m.56975 type:complete len:3649 (+) Transcript_26134:178-11124(+)|eukprot:CAMPEP_0203744804 /NCGR_PEP_ID=MMETSP0098-20131031/759_1 /ASSEMBLY_ACC=CAM_ASM_000208 /TAXON_ID=96639 /ORGANISM=" , Strain NY0313808BC1" /LENGTH=3648 /DNA_ID=CAMNT_0050632427 /DNA_START=1253 /DNA_END=12199 /DNA_ORIENTATION=+
MKRSRGDAVNESDVGPEWNWKSQDEDTLRVLNNFVILGIRSDGTKEYVPLEDLGAEKSSQYESFCAYGDLVAEPIIGGAASRVGGFETSPALDIELANKVLENLMNDPVAGPFLEPVDAEALGLTDYHQVITEPMDLGTIQTRLSKGYYQPQFGPQDGKRKKKKCLSKWIDPVLLTQDLKLVFNNCIQYNAADSEICAAARRMLDRRSRLWGRFGSKFVTNVNSEGEEVDLEKLEREAALARMQGEGEGTSLSVFIPRVTDYVFDYGLGGASSSLWLNSEHVGSSKLEKPEPAAPSRRRGGRRKKQKPEPIVEKQDTIAPATYYRIAVVSFTGEYTPEIRPSHNYQYYANSILSRFQACARLVHEIRIRTTPDSLLEEVNTPAEILLRVTVWCREIDLPLRPSAAQFWIDNVEFFREQLSNVGNFMLKSCGVMPFLERLGSFDDKVLDILFPFQKPTKPVTPPPFNQEENDQPEDKMELEEEEQQPEEQGKKSPSMKARIQRTASPVPPTSSANAGATVDDSERKQCKHGADLPFGQPLRVFVAHDEHEFENDKKAQPRNEALVGRRLEMLWPDDQTWYAGTITRYRPKTGLHLVKYDGDIENEAEWCYLNRGSSQDFTWRLLPEVEDAKHSKDDLVVVTLPKHSNLDTVSVPPNLLSSISRVYLFFQFFAERLEWKLQPFSFQEFVVAIMLKGSVLPGGEKKQPIPQLLMCIHLELVQAILNTSVEDFYEFKDAKKLLPVNFSPTTVLLNEFDDVGAMVRWAFDQMNRAIVDVNITKLVCTESENRWFLSGGSWQKDKLRIATGHELRDPGWFATSPVFLESLFHYYLEISGTCPDGAPRLNDIPVNLYTLYTLVKSFGGYREVQSETWVLILEQIPCAQSDEYDAENPEVDALETIYKDYLAGYEDVYSSEQGHGRLRSSETKVPLKNDMVMEGAPIGLPVGGTDPVRESIVQARKSSSKALTDYKDGPKRTNPYSVFVRENFQKHLGFAAASKLNSEAWSKMSEPEKQVYHKRAQKEDDRKVRDFLASKKFGKQVRTKGRSAFSFFAEDELAKSRCDKTTFRFFAAACGNLWKSMNTDERRPYLEMAEQDRTAVEMELALYDSRRTAISGDDVKVAMNSPVEITFFGVNELSWQEVVLELLCRMDGVENPRSTPAITGNLEHKKRSRMDFEDENGEDDVGRYDLKLEERKEVEYWNIPDIEDEAAKDLISEEASTVDECERLVEALLAHPLAAPFVEAVSADTPGMRNYHKVVKRPMHLGGVLERVCTGYYSISGKTVELEAFKADMMQIWANGKLFYKPTSREHEDAEHLEAVFLERFADLEKFDESNFGGMLEEKASEWSKEIIEQPDNVVKSRYNKHLSVMPPPVASRVPASVSTLSTLHQSPEEERIRLTIKYPPKVLGRFALATIMEDPESEPFSNRESVAQFGLVPRGTKFYQDRIDLGTIKVLLEKGFYDYYASQDKSTLAPKFVKDIRLMFLQIMESTTSENPFHVSAKRLCSTFLDIMKRGKLPANAPAEKVEASKETTHPILIIEPENVSMNDGSQGNLQDSDTELVAEIANAIGLEENKENDLVSNIVPEQEPENDKGVDYDVFPDACRDALAQVTNHVAYTSMPRTPDHVSPVPIILEKLRTGEYSMDDSGEIGNDLANDVRTLFSFWEARALAFNDVKALESVFEHYYAVALAEQSRNKWAWVGESILWVDNREAPPRVKRGQIQDYYAPPKYRYKNMRAKSDFYRMRVLVDKEVLPLNLWTLATRKKKDNKGLGSYMNVYGEHWAFASDKEAADMLLKANPVPIMVVPQKIPEKKADPIFSDEMVENLEEEDVLGLADGRAMTKIPVHRNHYWDANDLGSFSNDDTSIRELLATRNYADLEPQHKLRLIERLCDQILESFSARKKIASAYRLKQPPRFDRGPAEDSLAKAGPIPPKKKRGRKRKKKVLSDAEEEEADLQDIGSDDSFVIQTAKTTGPKRKTRGRRISYTNVLKSPQANQEDEENNIEDTAREKKASTGDDANMSDDEKKEASYKGTPSPKTGTEMEEVDEPAQEDEVSLKTPASKNKSKEENQSSDTPREVGKTTQKEVSLDNSASKTKSKEEKQSSNTPGGQASQNYFESDEDDGNDNNDGDEDEDLSAKDESNKRSSRRRRRKTELFVAEPADDFVRGSRKTQSTVKKKGKRGRPRLKAEPVELVESEDQMSTTEEDNKEEIKMFLDTYISRNSEKLLTEEFEFQLANCVDPVADSVDSQSPQITKPESVQEPSVVIEPKEEKVVEKVEEKDTNVSEAQDQNTEDTELKDDIAPTPKSERSEKSANEEHVFPMAFGKCKRALDSIIRDKSSLSFRKSNTGSAKIEGQMDFGTLKKNFNSGMYTRIDEDGSESVEASFLGDATLIFSNCFAFNEPGSDMFEKAGHCEARFNKLFGLEGTVDELNCSKNALEKLAFQRACESILNKLEELECYGVVKDLAGLSKTEKYRQVVPDHVDFDTIRHKLEQGTYTDELDALIRRAIRRGSTCDPSISQKSTGFARDVRICFRNCVEYFGYASLEAENIRELEVAFEELYASDALRESTVERVIWLGERIFAKVRGDGIMSGLIGGTVFSTNQLAFRVILQNGEVLPMNMWTKGTIVHRPEAKPANPNKKSRATLDVSKLPVLMYDDDWVFANDSQRVINMQMKQAKKYGFSQRVLDEANKFSTEFQEFIDSVQENREAVEEELENPGMSKKKKKKKKAKRGKKRSQSTSNQRMNRVVEPTLKDDVAIEDDELLCILNSCKPLVMMPEAAEMKVELVDRMKSTGWLDGSDVDMEPRFESMGHDRLGNTYWYFHTGRKTDVIQSWLFVSMSPDGSNTVGNVLRNSKVTRGFNMPRFQQGAGNWFVFSSRAQLHSLLSHLNEGQECEKDLVFAIMDKYVPIMTSMRTTGVEFSAPPMVDSLSEISRVRRIQYTFDEQVRVCLTSSPIIFGGSTFVRAIENTKTRLKLNSVDCGLRVGDILMSIGGRSVAGLAPEELANEWKAKRTTEIIVYRPEVCAVQQALFVIDRDNDALLRHGPSLAISSLLVAPSPSRESVFAMITALEGHLWSMGACETRIQTAIEDWRWLHGWGEWTWPLRRVVWHQRIMERTEQLENGAGIDLAISSLRTLCRAYISSLPPAQALNTEKDLEDFDFISSSLLRDCINMSQRTDGEHSPSCFKLSSAVYGLPLESDWLRELDQAKTFSHISMLATWVYIEAVSRFTSCVLISNRSKYRSLSQNRLKKRAIAYRLRRERLFDRLAWKRMMETQKIIRENVLKSLTDDEKQAVECLKRGCVLNDQFGEPSTPKSNANLTPRSNVDTAVAETSPPSDVQTNGVPDTAESTKPSDNSTGENETNPKRERDLEDDVVGDASVTKKAKLIEFDDDEPELKELRKQLQSLNEDEPLPEDVLEKLKTVVANKPKKRSGWLYFGSLKRQEYIDKRRADGLEELKWVPKAAKAEINAAWNSKTDEEKQVWLDRAVIYNERNDERYAFFMDRYEKCQSQIVEPSDGNQNSFGRSRRKSKKIDRLLGGVETLGPRSKTEPGQKSEFAGLSEHRGRWKVDIFCPDGESRYVGKYETEIAAAMAFDQAARLAYPLRVAEAVCNFPFYYTTSVLRESLPDISEFTHSYRVSLREDDF